MQCAKGVSWYTKHTASNNITYIYNNICNNITLESICNNQMALQAGKCLGHDLWRQVRFGVVSKWAVTEEEKAKVFCCILTLMGWQSEGLQLPSPSGQGQDSSSEGISSQECSTIDRGEHSCNPSDSDTDSAFLRAQFTAWTNALALFLWMQGVETRKDSYDLGT